MVVAVAKGRPSSARSIPVEYRRACGRPRLTGDAQRCRRLDQLAIEIGELLPDPGQRHGARTVCSGRWRRFRSDRRWGLVEQRFRRCNCARTARRRIGDDVEVVQAKIRVRQLLPLIAPPGRGSARRSSGSGNTVATNGFRCNTYSTSVGQIS